MPFGLINAPAVVQYPMQKILMDKNNANFVSVYINGTIVYSETLEQYLDHLKLVMD